MKILRIRRGYTTNSSAYTEWLPPPGGAAGQEPATPGSPGAAAAAPAVAATSGQAAAPQSASQLGVNTLAVAGIVTGLVMVILVERLIRWMRRKERVEASEDE